MEMPSQPSLRTCCSPRNPWCGCMGTNTPTRRADLAIPSHSGCEAFAAFVTVSSGHRRRGQRLNKRAFPSEKGYFMCKGTPTGSSWRCSPLFTRVAWMAGFTHHAGCLPGAEGNFSAAFLANKACRGTVVSEDSISNLLLKGRLAGLQNLFLIINS